MKGYLELAQMIVFSFTDAQSIFKNPATTYGALSRLEKQALIKKVRSNLYVCINPTTQTAFASKYQIGSSIRDDAFISHKSALEYYGLLNQVSQVCYVSTSSRFATFDFEGISYKHVTSKSMKGVVTPPYSNMIKITGVEKTIIDAIQTLDYLIGIEELIECLMIAPKLDESKLLEYLEEYNIQALYQKTGYLLTLLNDTSKLSDEFYKRVKQKIRKGVVYLTEEAKKKGVYNKTYQIVVPKWLDERGKQDEV